MKFKAEQKHLRLSPRKVRPIADVIRKLTPKRALEVLPFVQKRGSEPLIKVIKNAVASATEKGIDINNLSFFEIQIVEGPRLKRGRPVSRGRWHPIKKRMCHIKVILESKEVVKKAKKVKTQTIGSKKTDTVEKKGKKK
ncbi:50S ribosomal protein L22 [Candidatus Microgenomates bacterium]|nr:50S ribosomal protein L22 [Candidatus Microgenomates bacterium]